MRRSARLQGKSAPSSASITGKSTKFTDLPMELHIMIFEELIDTYTDSTGETLDPSIKPAQFRQHIHPLSLINSVWRIIVQEAAFYAITLRANELKDFTDTVKINPVLLGNIRKLTITSAAGDSMARESLRIRENISKEKALEEGKIYVKNKTAILMKNTLTVAKRADIFEQMWTDLVKLFKMAPGNLLNLIKLKITCNDILRGQFNEEVIPQVSLIPRKDGFCFASMLKSLPNTALRTLELEPKILEHLELDPYIVRKIICDIPEISKLKLNLSDIRGFRILRKEIFDGLVGILQGLNSRDHNLTSLKLKYASSFSRHQHSWSRAFALADYNNDNDPLSNALRTLSQNLVNFHYQGRISKHLFIPKESKERLAWPYMKRFVVELEAIDSFGRMLIIDDIDSWYEFDTWCDTCACSSVPECFDSYECREAHAVAHDASIGGIEEMAQNEEGTDALLCKNCRSRSLWEPTTQVKTNLVDELFIAASEAMVHMPRISEFTFKSTNGLVSFVFQMPKMTACIAKYWWKPNDAAVTIWKDRFPNLRFTTERLSSFMTEYLSDSEIWTSEEYDEYVAGYGSE